MDNKPTYEELETLLKEVETEAGMHRALADAPFEAIFLSEKGICLDQNLAAEKMFGYTRGEAIGRHGTEWIVPEDREQVMNNMLSGYKRPYEVVALRKTGTTFPCEIQARAMDHKGRSVRVTALRDITERKQARQLMKDELVRRRVLVEQSRDGIVVVDQDGKIYEANKRFVANLGYTEEEIQELHVWDWDVQWTTEHVMNMLRSVDETGDHFETVHRRKDGTLYDAEVSTNGAMYRGEKLVFCVCRDITARKRTEKERKALVEELQEALAEIKTLRGIIPICASCKRVRDDTGYWNQIESYIAAHSEAEFSHDICPVCVKDLFPDLVKKAD